MNSNKTQKTEEMTARVNRLFVDHDLTESEATAYILTVEQNLSVADAAGEMSRYAGKIVRSESVNTWKQRAQIKVSENIVTPAGVNDLGEEIRWVTILQRGNDEFITIERNEVEAVKHAHSIWDHLTHTERKDSEMTVGTMAIKPNGALSNEDVDVHRTTDWNYVFPDWNDLYIPTQDAYIVDESVEDGMVTYIYHANARKVGSDEETYLIRWTFEIPEEDREMYDEDQGSFDWFDLESYTVEKL